MLHCSERKSMGQIVTTVEGAVARITLSNPQKLNAISLEMWQALTLRVTALSKDDRARVIVIAGEGNDFSAGADISEFPNVRSTVEQAIHYHEKVIRPTLMALLACDKPVVAEIRGACVGGGLEIAACCDLRIADSTARAGIPIAKRGFPLAPFELRLVHALLGRAVVSELLLECRLLDAKCALAKGLFTRVVEPVELVADVRTTVDNLLNLDAQSLAANKHNLRRLLFAMDDPFATVPLTEQFAFAQWPGYQRSLPKV
jgi:enoyl-CoA hydratase